MRSAVLLVEKHTSVALRRVTRYGMEAVVGGQIRHARCCIAYESVQVLHSDWPRCTIWIAWSVAKIEHAKCCIHYESHSSASPRMVPRYGMESLVGGQNSEAKCCTP